MFNNFADITGATKEDDAPRVGSFVKAVFLNEEDRGEGMWIRVTKVLDNLNYEGVLDNKPFYIPLEIGAEVSFDWRHVREVKHPED
jgi:hypothetical protein